MSTWSFLFASDYHIILGEIDVKSFFLFFPHMFKKKGYSPVIRNKNIYL